MSSYFPTSEMEGMEGMEEGSHSVLFFFTFWIFREPPLLHPLFLLEEFEDAPEKGACQNAEQSGDKIVRNEK